MADSAYSGLSAASTLTGAEIFAVDQGGISVRTTVALATSIPVAVRTISALPDTPTTADVNKILESTVGTAGILNITNDSTGSWSLQDSYVIVQIGGGQITLTPGSGVTLLSPNGLKTRTTGSEVSVRRRAANYWVVSGDTTT